MVFALCDKVSNLNNANIMTCWRSNHMQLKDLPSLPITDVIASVNATLVGKLVGRCSSSRQVDAKIHPSVGSNVTEISPVGRDFEPVTKRSSWCKSVKINSAFINCSWLGWGEY